jgi:hypothetical protein
MAFPGLNFLPGIGVEAAIRSRYGEPVNYFPIQGLKEFTLLVSVGRCKFKLSEQCIGFLLQANLGGVAVDFRPQQIYDRVFKFVVASRNVGFHIYKLRSYLCEQYKIFFHLSGNGGAHWNLESKKYAEEEQSQWTAVLSKAERMQQKSYADIIRGRHLNGANRVPIGNRLQRRSVFQRIQWPSAEFWAALL